MTSYPGRRRNKPGDPTDEPVSDPVPTGEDVVNRHERSRDTPRRHDEPVKDPVLPAEDDATLNTRI
jgi:hypothetical protein